MILLLAGTALAASSVRGRDAQLAEQAATLQAVQAQQVAAITRQNAAITLQEEYRAQLEQGLAMQAAKLAAQDQTLNTYAEITTSWQRTGQMYAGQILTLSKIAALDTELIAAIGQRDSARVEMERALTVADHVGWARSLVQVNESQRRLDALLSQRTSELGRLSAVVVSAPNVPAPIPAPLPYLPWPGADTVPVPAPLHRPWPSADTGPATAPESWYDR